jgi:hypothetical protein
MRTRRPRPARVVRSAFAGFRFPPGVIVLAVRWYLRFGLSHRDVEELLTGRGVEVDHGTIDRWVQRFTPLLADAARPCRRAVGQRWFVDETDVKVAGQRRYVYQGRRADPGQPRPGQVRPAAAADDRADLAASAARRQQRRRAGTRADVADRQPVGLRLPPQPAGRRQQPVGEPLDVGDLGAVALLVGGEQVDQQRRGPRPVQGARQQPVARAVATAAGPGPRGEAARRRMTSWSETWAKSA